MNLSIGKPLISTHLFSARLWGGLCAIALAICWLLPNHYFPWLAFHSEAWAGVWGLVLVLWVLLCLPPLRSWPLPATACLIISIIPWLQYALSLLEISGQAWVSSVYLLSLSLALIVGWQMQCHRQYLLLNILAAGVAIGAVISVGIQLIQWLQLYSSQPGSWFSILVFPIEDTARPMSNLAQPNLLSTLLVTGMASLLWLFQQNLLKRWLAMAGLVLLCFGIALTQSRVGILELGVLAYISWHFRQFWKEPQVAWWLPAVLGLRIALFWILPALASWVGLETTWRNIAQISQNSDRWIIWVASVELLSSSPWWGSGWRSMLSPLMQTSAMGYLGHSHSIILDLLLWCGIPLAILILAAFVVIALAVYRRIQTIEQALTLMLIMPTCVHALVELPHHYLNFLIAPAMAFGALLAMQYEPTAQAPRKYGFLLNLPWVQVPWSNLMLWLVWITAAISAHFIIKDYFRAEAYTWQIRLEDNNGLAVTEHIVPPMFALNHLQGMIEFLPKKPQKNLSPTDLEWMERSIDGETAPSNHFVLMANLALAGQMDRARYLMWTLVKSVPEQEANMFRQRWLRLQQQYSELASLNWPERGAPLVKPSAGYLPYKASGSSDTSPSK
jgi:O-antigen ligase